MDATLRVVARDGVSGVTHRTVAREADVPTTASTYYFASIDDLLCDALSTCMREDAEKLRVIADSLPDDVDCRPAIAAMMADLVAKPDGHLLAEYELFLLAARRPELRESTELWAAAAAEFARRFTTDPVRVDLFVSAFDGLLLRALLANREYTAADFEAALRILLPWPAPEA
nr:TetR family transcriptional regulator [Stackebrandtia nassauensis]